MQVALPKAAVDADFKAAVDADFYALCCLSQATALGLRCTSSTTGARSGVVDRANDIHDVFVLQGWAAATNARAVSGCIKAYCDAAALPLTTFAMVQVARPESARRVCSSCMLFLKGFYTSLGAHRYQWTAAAEQKPTALGWCPLQPQ